MLPLDEVEEIRDEEHTMLDELDELVLGFESKYNDLGIPLGEFLRGYWSEQMAEVLSHETILDKDEACRVRQLGVRLEYNFP
jgi:ferritin